MRHKPLRLRPIRTQVLTRAQAHRLIQPCVYLLVRGKAVLYIGQSRVGWNRVLRAEIVKPMKETDRLIVLWMDTAAAAEALEELAIHLLRPTRNRTFARTLVLERLSKKQKEQGKRALRYGVLR